MDVASKAVPAFSVHKRSCSREKGLLGSLWGEHGAGEVSLVWKEYTCTMLSVGMFSTCLLKINILK